jgi:hypothetical protein
MEIYNDKKPTMKVEILNSDYYNKLKRVESKEVFSIKPMFLSEDFKYLKQQKEPELYKLFMNGKESFAAVAYAYDKELVGKVFRVGAEDKYGKAVFYNIIVKDMFQLMPDHPQIIETVRKNKETYQLYFSDINADLLQLRTRFGDGIIKIGYLCELQEVSEEDYKKLKR